MKQALELSPRLLELKKKENLDEIFSDDEFKLRAMLVQKYCTVKGKPDQDLVNQLLCMRTLYLYTVKLEEVRRACRKPRPLTACNPYDSVAKALQRIKSMEAGAA